MKQNIRGLFKKYREFWMFAGYVHSIFCGVMLVLISLTYAAKFGLFECSVNFWQLFCLDVFGSSSLFASSVSGTRKNHREPDLGNTVAAATLLCCFWPKFRAQATVCVLSWCKGQFLFFNKSGRFWRIASHKLHITCR